MLLPSGGSTVSSVNNVAGATMYPHVSASTPSRMILRISDRLCGYLIDWR